MKIEDLEIGKEYYLDCFKTEKGIYISNKINSIYFMPTVDTDYLTEKDGSVCFLTLNGVSPV